MKFQKLVVGLMLLAMSGVALAHGPYYDYRMDPRYPRTYGHYHGGTIVNNYRGQSAGDVLVPMAIGGIIGYGISQGQQREKETVIIQKEVPVVQPNNVPANQEIYEYQTIFDAQCNCYRKVLVKIQ